MAVKKRGLGKGLDALIVQGSEVFEEEKVAVQEEVKDGIIMMDIYKVEPDREQPRKEFDEEKINELADSIRQYGVLQPLLVQKCEGYYKIIAGERRWRAAKVAGVKEVPVIIKEYSSEKLLEVSLIENIQRQDLNPMEEAQAYQRLLQEYKLTQEEIATRVSKSRSAIANYLRLLNLEPQVQDMVAMGQLSAGHAKVLLGVEDKEVQCAFADKIVQEGLSVRQLEKLVQSLNKKPVSAKDDKPADNPWLYDSISSQMRDILGTKVNIIRGAKKSKIEIEYYSDEDLERLMDLFQSLQK